MRGRTTYLGAGDRRWPILPMLNYNKICRSDKCRPCTPNKNFDSLHYVVGEEYAKQVPTVGVEGSHVDRSRQ